MVIWNHPLLLKTVLHHRFKDQIALFSSFGADSALLISLVAEVGEHARNPVSWYWKAFSETLEYVETLKQRFKLTNIILLKPDPNLVKNIDAKGELWSIQPNRCCWMRKVEPLQRAVREMGIKALITGRKRYQTKERGDMTYFQIDEDGIFRINRTYWERDKIRAAFAENDFQRIRFWLKAINPIGCAPALPVAEGWDKHDGRWAHTMNLYGEKKNECGLHIDTSEFSI